MFFFIRQSKLVIPKNIVKGDSNSLSERKNKSRGYPREIKVKKRNKISQATKE